MAHPDKSKRVPSTSVKRTGGPSKKDLFSLVSVASGGKAGLIQTAFNSGLGILRSSRRGSSGGSGGGGTLKKKKKIKAK
tara:strand:- start:285 stop:521 length:237 start_codon:yes stop_codon:yes gene_type:complete